MAALLLAAPSLACDSLAAGWLLEEAAKRNLPVFRLLDRMLSVERSERKLRRIKILEKSIERCVDCITGLNHPDHLVKRLLGLGLEVLGQAIEDVHGLPFP